MSIDSLTVAIALIGLLILLNGFFAAGEIAIVTASAAKLQALADKGDRRAQAALRLKADPDRFLATVQIGVTLVGTLASAVGGVTAIERLEPLIAGLAPGADRFAEPIAVGLIVFAIAYVSLVVGELVPKSFAVRNAETLALWTAPKIQAISRVSGPAVAVLTASSRLFLRAAGQKVVEYRPFHTLEDLKAIAAAAEEQGVVKGDLVSGAIEFHEREVREVLTPRHRIRALQLGVSLADALRTITDSGHSRFPAYTDSLDDCSGFVYARDVYEAALSQQPFDLGGFLHRALTVQENKKATALLSQMRRNGIPLALVSNEDGVLVGLVTVEDLVEVIVGEIRDEHKTALEPVRVISNRAVEAEGSIPVHELKNDHGLDLPESPDYVSIGGLVMDRLKRVPRAEDAVEVPPYRIEVVHMDGARISRVRITRTSYVLEAAR